MTDDLVKRLPERLRLAGDWLNHDVKLTSQTIMHLAADRIEQLEEKLRKENDYAYVIDSQGIVHHSFTIVYRDTLGEKKDG